MENTALITKIKDEINAQLVDADTMSSLLVTTFKGLNEQMMKRALLEGMMRGFTFKDFLEKNIYAIPFGSGDRLSYSLITSIDYARKIGMRSGIVGVSEPTFTTVTNPTNQQQEVESCTVTVKKMVNGTIGDFTATVFFSEYYKAGKSYNGQYMPSMWDKMPRAMITKVAEMTALRKACPEELSQAYIQEEKEREIYHEDNVVDITDYSEREAELRAVKTLTGLSDFWKKTTAAEKIALKEAKDEMKAILDTEVKETTHENS